LPWARIVSCNPAEVKDPDVPPTFSGYPIADRGEWAAYEDEYRRALGPLQGSFNEFCRERGAPSLADLEFIHTSPTLNLWLYPRELDYERAHPLEADGTWHRLESCVRSSDPTFTLPEPLASQDGPLVYLSLGSLGSADVELMRSLIASLAEMPYRVIVSKGPQHAELELAENMYGEEFLPQPSILPLADVVITHGGNNTVTECIHFGKPTVALPLFWDQYDNAQRLDETGFGVRLRTYEHQPGELRAAIDGLLADEALRGRLADASARLRSAPGTERAADLVEGLAAAA
jgi:MGT family glycosyltransferase